MDEASGGRVHVALRLVRGAGSGRGMQRRESRGGPLAWSVPRSEGEPCWRARPDRTDEQLD